LELYLGDSGASNQIVVSNGGMVVLSFAFPAVGGAH